MKHLIIALVCCSCSSLPETPTLSVSNSFTVEEQQAIVSAADEWNALSQLHNKRDVIHLSFGENQKDNWYHDWKSQVYAVTSQDKIYSLSSKQDFFANTVSRTKGGEREETDVIFAIDVIENRRHNSPLSKEEFFKSIVLHEFGHVIGLVHSNDPNSVMNTSTRRKSTIDVVEEKEFCTAFEC
jgi:predicted Zn-dependent protease